MLIFCYYNSKTTIYNRNGIILLLLQIILCYFNRHISKRDVCKERLLEMKYLYFYEKKQVVF